MKNNWKEEFYKVFEINQGSGRINGYITKNVGEDYSRPATVEDFEMYVEALLEEQKKELMGKTNKLIDLYGAPNCDYLHHNKSQYHKGGVFCPVVRETLALIESLKHHD